MDMDKNCNLTQLSSWPVEIHARVQKYLSNQKNIVIQKMYNVIKIGPFASCYFFMIRSQNIGLLFFVYVCNALLIWLDSDYWLTFVENQNKPKQTKIKQND